MQFKTFSKYISPVIDEGNRLQKTDDTGKPITKRKFSSVQLTAVLLSIGSLWLIPTGFSTDFAGYIIGFLGIFVGLFASLVLAMEDKSKTLYENWDEKTDNQKVRDRLMRNYIVRFTGLTAYSILIGLVVIILLAMVLLFPQCNQKINQFQNVHGLNQLYFHLVKALCKLLLLAAHRAITIYLLLNLFTITVFSITSYFTHLSRQYKNLKIPDA